MSIRIVIRALTVVMVAAGAVAVAAQQATFKGAVRTVAVYATVTEPGGRLVPDLSRDTFSVDDNGTPQDLTVFANDLQPITVVMMIDRSGSMRSQFELVQQAAEQFVGELRPGDKARIGSFSNRIQVDPRTFTSDKDELIGILRRELQEEGPTPLWNAVNVGITALLHEEGRRVILVFTDGMDEPLNPGPNSSTLRDVMKRAEAEDVMVYAIGLAGTSAPPRAFGGQGRGRGGWGGGGFGGGPYGRGGGRGRGSGPGTGVGKVDPGLAKIAEATGGGYFELTGTDDLGATFRRVAEELHHQYLLGFTPKVLDGKTHRLAVRVKHEGLTVRARRTYLAARD